MRSVSVEAQTKEQTADSQANSPHAVLPGPQRCQPAFLEQLLGIKNFLSLNSFHPLGHAAEEELLSPPYRCGNLHLVG